MSSSEAAVINKILLKYLDGQHMKHYHARIENQRSFRRKFEEGGILNVEKMDEELARLMGLKNTKEEQVKQTFRPPTAGKPTPEHSD